MTDATVAQACKMFNGKPHSRFVVGNDCRQPAAAVGAAGSGPMPIPTLYLHGADDGCMGVEITDRAALDGLLPDGSEVRIVPASGHFLQLERPAEVNALILEFLAT